MGRAAAKSAGGKASVGGVNEIAGAITLGSGLACVGVAAFVGGWIGARGEPEPGGGTAASAEGGAAAWCWTIGSATWGEPEASEACC